ncbi:hypothetical protein N9Z02_01660 [Akkermansiaceae bacterium]|nr:hypothetical protein [Akkermansiaceae bacterium]
MKKKEVQRTEVFFHSLPLALLLPFAICFILMFLGSGELIGGFLYGGIALAVHFIAYAIVAPFVYLFLTPDSKLWRPYFGVPLGGLLGALACTCPFWNELGNGGALFGIMFIGIGYGAITATAAIGARRKMLKE